MTNKAQQLRDAVRSAQITVVPTAYDALSARVIEQLEFPAVHVGGFLGAGSILGLPDLGLFTATECVTRGANIAETVKIPVILDVDTGFGNAINTYRCIRDVVRAGIAGIHIEDQVFPKRCGQYGMGEMAVISLEDMVSKLRAVRDAQEDADLFLIARTDAVGAGLGVDEALLRARAYAAAGADAVMAIMRSYDDLKRFMWEWERNVPVVAVPTRFAGVSSHELQDLGFSMVFYTEIAARAALHAVRSVLTQLRDSGSIGGIEDQLVPTEYLYELVHLPEYREMEKAYGAVQ